MSSNPFFISIPRVETVVPNLAANRQGSSGSFLLWKSNPISGSKIDFINVYSATNIKSGVSGNNFWLWMSDADGSNPILIREGKAFSTNYPYIDATTFNIGNGFTFNFINGLYLGTNSSIYCGQLTYDTTNLYHWEAFGADL